MTAVHSTHSAQYYNWDTFFFAEETPEVHKLVERRFPTFRDKIAPLVKEYLFKRKKKGPFCSRCDTNDFGIQIERLRFGYPARTIFGPDMEAVAKQLGFQLDYTIEEWFYPRDNFVRIEHQKSKTGRTLILQPLSDTIQTSIHRVWESANSRNPNAVSGSASSMTLYHDAAINDYMEMFPNDVPWKSPWYFEGGNLFYVSHPTDPNRNAVLMGEESLLMAVVNARREKFFDTDNKVQTVAMFRKRVKEIEAGLTDDEVFKTAKEMYLLGLLKFKNEERSILLDMGTTIKDAVNNAPQRKVSKEVREKELAASKEEYLKAVHLVADHRRGADTFAIPEVRKPWVKGVVAKFLAQKETIKLMFAYMFRTLDKIPRVEDVIVIPQLDYHLDCFLKPGPGNIIFLQDYLLCRDMLLQILEYADALQLTEEDRKLVQDYIKEAERLAAKMEPLAAEVRKVLEAAGFNVIATPAAFSDSESKEKPIHINLINAISGSSKNTGRYYYIVAGVTVGDNLGDAIMLMIRSFFKRYEIDVYFVGKTANAASTAACRMDFKAVTEWCSSNHANVHCLSIEIQVKSHKDNPELK